jgi:hypothetical protein
VPLAAATLGEQDLVNLAEEAIRDREPLAHPFDTVLECTDVARDFADVVERNAGRLIQLEQQQVGERGLRAFDL